MNRVLTFIILLFFSSALCGQKKQLDKANSLYKNGEYASAIPLYEEALSGKKGGISSQSKLAYCYRMNNRLAEAEKLYSKIVLHKRAREITYFYYGEALMSNEKYDEAKEWFQKYTELKPKDERAPAMIRACDEVRNIKPLFENAAVVMFPQNSEEDDNAPVFWNGGVVFTSDRPSGVKMLQEKSGATGRDFLNLYFAKEISEEGDFEKPSPLSNKLSELNKNSGFASFSGDSTQVFFTKNNNLINKNDSYNLQLFKANTSDNNFKKVKKLNFCSGELNYMHPSVSVDGNRLFFTSDKGGGEGGTDLYVSVRNGDKWGVPKNLGDVINTPGNEGFPFSDEKGNLYFCSKGHIGFGGFDIFVTRQNPDGTWQKPRNLGKPINSSLDDISISIERGGKRGLFTSSRSGGDDDVFLIYFEDEFSEN